MSAKKKKVRPEKSTDPGRQTEEILANEGNLLDTLMDNIPDHIYFKDTGSRFRRVNQAQAQALGVDDPRAAIGKTDFDFFEPEQAQLFYADEQAIVQTGQPLIDKVEAFREGDGQLRWVSTTKAPILDRTGQVTGIVGISRDITERKRSETEKARLFDEVSQQQARLRALTARLAEAEDAERKQLARELHDQVGQNLTALGLNLNIIRSQLTNQGAPAGLLCERLDDSLRLVEETTERIRNVMANLRPPVLDDYGLVAALGWYQNRLAEWADLTITVRGEEPSPRLPPAVENALFRIAQEALTNVVKHARASQVTVTVEVEPARVRLVIADDGIGFEPVRPTEFAGRQSWGLLTMTERAEAIDGRCRIESGPGQGTWVMVEVKR